MRLKIAFLMLALLLCTTACGNRGALYLPDAAQNAKENGASTDSAAQDSAKSVDGAPEPEEDSNPVDFSTP